MLDALRAFLAAQWARIPPWAVWATLAALLVLATLAMAVAKLAGRLTWSWPAVLAPVVLLVAAVVVIIVLAVSALMTDGWH